MSALAAVLGVVAGVLAVTEALTAAERRLVLLAGVGVVGWLVTDQPLMAMACVIASDLVATWLMLPKTWRSPGSETLSTYVMASAGGAAAAASIVATLSATPAAPVRVAAPASLLAYPVYFCLVNGVVAAVLVLRRRATVPPVSLAVVA